MKHQFPTHYMSSDGSKFSVDELRDKYDRNHPVKYVALDGSIWSNPEYCKKRDKDVLDGKRMIAEQLIAKEISDGVPKAPHVSF